MSVQVRESKTKFVYAEFMKWLVDTHYPNTDKIKLVQDNYCTHQYGSFYENLPFEYGRQLRKKMNFIYTPKHGSWLNMAEIEFAAIARQRLDRRIGGMKHLEAEALIRQENRNKKAVKVDWSFVTENARIKLKNRYAEIKAKDHVST